MNESWSMGQADAKTVAEPRDFHPHTKRLATIVT